MTAPGEPSAPSALVELRVLDGANLYFPRPAVKLTLDLTRLLDMDEDAARSVVLDNGDWDGGLADLLDPAADGLDIWIVRGDPATGGYLPDAWLPDFAARIGADHILTIAGGPHSPMRTHPVETTADLLHALGD